MILNLEKKSSVTNVFSLINSADKYTSGGSFGGEGGIWRMKKVQIIPHKQVNQ